MHVFRTLVVMVMGLWIASPTEARPLFDTPVYDEHTRSYFVLVNGRSYHHEGPTWAESKMLAERRHLAGVQGRLAIIPSVETDLFIRLNLRPNRHTWFGLRYDCASRQLVWSDGTVMDRGGYTNWSPDGWLTYERWGLCPANNPHMGVYQHLTRQHRHWKAVLTPKRWWYFIVEYPTGRRLSEAELAQGQYDTRVSPALIAVPDSRQYR